MPRTDSKRGRERERQLGVAALKRTFNLAVRDGRLNPTLEEDNALQVSSTMIRFLPCGPTYHEYLRDPMTFLQHSGWRLGEMKPLDSSGATVDLAGEVVHPRPEISKNKSGRVVPLSGKFWKL